MLEQKIEALTAAVVKLTEVMQANQQVAPTVTPAPSVQEAKPVETPAAVAAAVAPMPELPSFAAPVETKPAATAPFTDAKGMIEYVMAAYKAMGPEKGAGIQQVLVSLGHDNINNVKPEQYGALYAGVEALK